MIKKIKKVFTNIKDTTKDNLPFISILGITGLGVVIVCSLIKEVKDFDIDWENLDEY